jgi:hypothetical protein
MPEKEENVPAYTDGIEGQEGKVDEEMVGRIDTFNTVLINLMHSEQTKNETLTMLKDDGDEDDSESDPFISIPNAAVTINDMGVALMAESGVTVDFAVQLAGSSLLINDLIQLGYAAELWDELSTEEIKAIYEDALQIVIERGLKDGSIDPIQLQLDAEGLMDENQKSAGSQLAQEKGLGEEPSEQAVMEQHGRSRELKAKQDASSRVAKEKDRALQMQPEGGM